MNKEPENTPRQINVIITHHVRVLREGLARILITWPELSIAVGPGVDTAGQPVCHEESRMASPVDVVLLDAGSSTPSLAESIQQAKNKFGSAKVIVIGVVDHEDDILAGIEAGAAAYTVQDSSPQHLVDTIRRVHLGEVYCPPQVSALLFERVASLKSQLIPVQDNKLTQLTRRETQILQLISEGSSNKEIAANLSLELQTVKNYVHKILEKLRVQNRRDAATYARSAAVAEAANR